jgi:GNAT superfamily N-acetyltransferase
VSDLVIREAGPGDLEAIIRLHEADELGGPGDAWTLVNRPAYEAAFARIRESRDHTIYVAIRAGEVVGTFQITLMPALTSRGKLRAVLASVQVRADQRSQGIGARMVAFAEKQAKADGAASLQLTSNKARPDAHRFYERLGFAKTHEGFRKSLNQP